MALPKGKLETRTVELSGGVVEVRSLTLAESKEIGSLDGDKVARAIAYATGEPEADVVEWLATAPAGDATKLMTAITEVSGLSEAAQFRDHA